MLHRFRGMLFQGRFAWVVGASLLLGTTAQAAGITGGAPLPIPSTSKPTSGGPSSQNGAMATPAALYPNIVADGGGVQLGGKFAPFNGSVSVNSTVIMPPQGPHREDRPGQEICRFAGSFRLKNIGGGAASGFDVYTWLDQQGGKIDDTGYYIPGIGPGGTYSQNFGFDLRPGTYVFHLGIDPYHKLKQSSPQTKQYSVTIKTTCGNGYMTQVPGRLVPPKQ